jgi:hypothetical protein
MLLSLPTELILEISVHLHGDDVSQICLASTCRQMYADIIPEVRKEHAEHVQDFLIPVGFLGIYKSDSAIVPRHKGVHGVEIGASPAEAMLNGEAGGAFQGNTGTVNIWLLPKQGKDIRAVRSLLVSAPALKHIHLQIPASCRLQVLVNTLSMCAARPSTRLTITDSLRIWSREIIPALGRTTSSTLDKSRSSKLRLPKALRRLRRDTAQPLLSVQEPPPSITALSIANDVLFFFEIYPLLLRLMNTASLESLHLGRPPVHELGAEVPVVLQSHWSAILSSITTRATRVSFTLVPIAPEDLLAFLVRHPHITRLTLEISTLAGGVSFNSTPLLLPNLTTLEGVWSTILPFLAARKDGHLPALQHLILKSGRNNLSLQKGMKNHPLHAVYDHITRHDLQYASIQIPSLSSCGLISWLVGPSSDSSTSTSVGSHDASPRRLTNVKKLIFRHGAYEMFIPPNWTAATMAWVHAHAPWSTADNDRGVQTDCGDSYMDNTSTDANDTSSGLNDRNTEAQEKQDALTNQIIVERLLRRVCPDLMDIEMLHIPGVYRWRDGKGGPLSVQPLSLIPPGPSVANSGSNMNG